jgi:uncharacterized membrane protein YhhN
MTMSNQPLSGLLILAILIATLYLFKFLNKPQSLARSVTKTLPVLILTLAAGLSGHPLLIAAGLFACAAGDWFLSLEGETNFLLGLGSFLFGHLFYIGYFLQSAPSLDLTSPDSIQTAILLSGLLGMVLLRLWTYLDNLKGPVILYAFAIAAMAYSAKIAGANTIVLAGIASFMVSDIMLAYDKFTPLARTPVRMAMPYLVWVTYILAQTAIVFGLASF